MDIGEKLVFYEYVDFNSNDLVLSVDIHRWKSEKLGLGLVTGLIIVISNSNDLHEICPKNQLNH